MATLVLPNLQALLSRLQKGRCDRDDERSWSPPHERALAHALGWLGSDGLWPWAAWQAAADGLDSRSGAWALVTPAHWHLGSQQLTLIDPDALLLDAAASRAFFNVVLPLFTSAGFELHWAAPLRWYAVHTGLQGLRSASLDRVIGRNVDAWLGSDPAAQRLRRLQAEVQMLLYTHPLNDDRQARQLPTVNSFWLSGCGPYQATPSAPPLIDARLRSPALNEDWAAWAKAWQALDEGPLAALLMASSSGSPVHLTLCGERAALTLEPAPTGLWQRLRRHFHPARVLPLLETL